MKIIGATIGTTLPKPNFDQTDPKKGDYIKGDRSFLRAIKTINGASPDENGNLVIAADETLTKAGVAADAKATGDAISQVNALVGDTDVATQISNAIANQGTLAVSKGGTGATEPVAARENLLMIVSDTEPASPTAGMLWFDIS